MLTTQFVNILNVCSYCQKLQYNISSSLLRESQDLQSILIFIKFSPASQSLLDKWNLSGIHAVT